MRGWHNLFNDQIRKRGYDYYLAGNVINLKEVKYEMYEAIVAGEKDYEVEIEVHNGEIRNMDCSCPYASKGYNCKHMAAVLYAIEEGLHDVNEPLELLKEAIKVQDKETLENIILDYMKTSERFKKHLLKKFKIITKQELILIKGTIQSISNRYKSDNGDYIASTSLASYFFDLNRFLKKQVSSLIGVQNEFAFDLCNAVFFEILYQKYEEKSTLITRVCQTIKQYWLELYQVSNEKEKIKMLTWFDDYIFHEGNEEVEHLIADCLSELEFSEKLINIRFDYVNQILHTSLKKRYFQLYLQHACDLLMMNHKSLDELLNYLEIFKESKFVINYKIKLMWKFKEYEYAASYIRKLILVNKGNHDVINELEGLLEKTKKLLAIMDKNCHKG